MERKAACCFQHQMGGNLAAISQGCRKKLRFHLVWGGMTKSWGQFLFFLTYFSTADQIFLTGKPIWHIVYIHLISKSIRHLEVSFSPYPTSRPTEVSVLQPFSETSCISASQSSLGLKSSWTKLPCPICGSVRRSQASWWNEFQTASFTVPRWD